MTSAKPLHVSIVVGRTSHPQAVIDDLWRRVEAAVDQRASRVTGTAVYASDGGPAVTVRDDRLDVLPLTKLRGGSFAAVLSHAAGKSGPVGVVGRLIRDNVESRRLAGALDRDAELQKIFQASDIVVAADVTADRSVWKLRKRTEAELVHGPTAMLHALREAVRG